MAVFVGLHALLQRRLESEVLRRHNDVAGFLFSAVGVLYAVVLGFVVVVVWEKYDSTVSNVENEVDAAGNLYHVVDGFPTRTARSDPRPTCGVRRASSLDIEWPAMERDQDVPRTRRASGSRRRRTRSTRSRRRTSRQFAAQQAAIAERTAPLRRAPRAPDRDRCRRCRRCCGSRSIAGALAMVAFCYIFGVENRPAQLVMTAILVGLIGILFVVIAEFSTPFSGSVRISSDGWVYLQQRLPHISSAASKGRA